MRGLPRGLPWWRTWRSPASEEASRGWGGRRWWKMRESDAGVRGGGEQNEATHHVFEGRTRRYRRVPTAPSRRARAELAAKRRPRVDARGAALAVTMTRQYHRPGSRPESACESEPIPPATFVPGRATLGRAGRTSTPSRHHRRVETQGWHPSRERGWRSSVRSDRARLPRPRPRFPPPPRRSWADRSRSPSFPPPQAPRRKVAAARVRRSRSTRRGTARGSMRRRTRSRSASRRWPRRG